ncbi:MULTISPECIES: S41 family peptidase [unclassified Streptomyces]|uniref:S41 family peptidase n=1 Tax=unclassified Streptomyces TaxID=2593676 RepID=UPI0006FF0BA9|nr:MULTISPECIES: S41 family peptidase [unclassified Streptomyces]KQX52680.1 peptidase S41 [Streptomyces sp. Root1304]KRA89594.1 peptidase S41 [Streptomyces sp. Root66D1]
MPTGTDLLCLRPRGVLRGAVLTLLFTGVLATAAATGSLPRQEAAAKQAGASGNATGGADGATVDGAALSRAAAAAMADGKSGKKAAEEFVSRSGDRWGAVYDKKEYAEFEQALDGAYTGVGLSAGRADAGRVRVTRVRAGSPAERAGLRTGDRLVSVDGRPVDGLSVSEVVSLLRGGGVEGSAVTLRVERGRATWTQTLHRARVATEPVTVSRLDDGTLMIRVAAFTKGAGTRVRDAVRAAPAGAGVLLDLRGNAGGLVSEAAVAASAFLDGGLVATYDVEGEQRAVYAEGGGDTARPLVALIDGGTMSAAELLTGALQDRGRAVTVGSRTFGKGSVQMPSALPDGSVAELTVGHYRTPAGHAVDGRGIMPDLAAGERAEDRARTVLSGLGGGS